MYTYVCVYIYIYKHIHIHTLYTDIYTYVYNIHSYVPALTHVRGTETIKNKPTDLGISENRGPGYYSRSLMIRTPKQGTLIGPL